MIAGGMSMFSFCELTEKIYGDMDIWIQVSSNFNPKINSEKEVLNKKYYDLNTNCPFKKKVTKDFGRFARECSNTDVEAYNSGYYRINPIFETNIYKIFHFSYENKKIQLFLTYLSNSETLSMFDRSCCATSWNGNEFYSLTLDKLYNLMPS